MDGASVHGDRIPSAVHSLHLYPFDPTVEARVRGIQIPSVEHSHNPQTPDPKDEANAHGAQNASPDFVLSHHLAHHLSHPAPQPPLYLPQVNRYIQVIDQIASNLSVLRHPSPAFLSPRPYHP